MICGGFSRQLEVVTLSVFELFEHIKRVNAGSLEIFRSTFLRMIDVRRTILRDVGWCWKGIQRACSMFNTY